ncbi:hypothetical protein HRI_004251400 [Hibiscus trionum]|uniref:WRKY domain-containing protein n=1 Tax=Hibiscus trionum TaxID=183268 RepID=A0A9W7J367_HIBTR|nr:hypothetical protein HRI_004251400 [Hibiscus trionum]
MSSNSSFLSSAITEESSGSNSKKGSSLFWAPVPGVLAGKPTLSLVPCTRRKSRVKKVIRVPAISSVIADVPADEYSWRKYGQKPIKGSPYPRGYCKCSTFRGCPARKHVDRDTDDPSMLILTYEGEHHHSQPVVQKNMAPVEGCLARKHEEQATDESSMSTVTYKREHLERYSSQLDKQIIKEDVEFL